MLGASSLKELDTCHPKIGRLMREVDRRVSKRRVQKFDIKAVCGHRGEVAQEQAFRDGNSDKHWPDSRHNTLPSTALDLTPFPELWSDPELLMLVIGYVLAVADELDIELEVGALWHKRDRPHIQLTEYELSRP